MTRSWWFQNPLHAICAGRLCSASASGNKVKVATNRQLLIKSAGKYTYKVQYCEESGHIIFKVKFHSLVNKHGEGLDSERGAKDDEKVTLGKVYLSHLEETQWQRFPEEHNVRLHQTTALFTCTFGYLILEDLL